MDAHQNLAKRLVAADADVFLAGLLSQDEMQAIHDRRLKKAKIKAKKTGQKVTSKTFREVREDEYIIKDGGLDDAGNPVDDFDIVSYMNDAEDPATGTLRDLRIDTREMYHAKNYYDFAFNVLKMNPSYNLPWARQMWIGLMLFGEVCPVCSDPRVFDIHNIPKDLEITRMTKSIKLLEHGVCSKCKRHKWDLIKNHGLNNYQQLVNVLGQRSGKSSSAAGYFCYIDHQYLMFPSLPQLAPTAMQASTELTCTMVSLTFSKAIGVLWTPFMNTINESPWHDQYFKILDHYGEQYDREFYSKNTLFLKYAHKKLRYYPSGPKSSTLRGDTRFAAGLDELGLFRVPGPNEEEDEQSERANADEAHKSLTNSLVTVQGVVHNLLKQGYSSAPPALMISVSSPISHKDKIMRLLGESRTDLGKKLILGIQLPTWEMNPNIHRDSPAILAAYNSNPEKAQRDFGADPPRVYSQFVSPSLVDDPKLFRGGHNSHNFIYQYDRSGEIYGKVERVRSFRYPSLVTIDAGVADNSFTLVGGHYNFDTGETVCTTILECMPQEGRRVNFNQQYLHTILPVLRDLRAVQMMADQWQSIDLLNRARDDLGNNPNQKPRLLSKQYSPKRKDFDAVLALLTNKSIVLPAIDEQDRQNILAGRILNYKTEMVGKPVAHLLLQMLTVRDMGELKNPEKGEDFTDDIFRAFVLWVSKLHDPKVMDRLKEAKDWTYGEGSSARMPSPAFMGRSGGRFPGLR